MRGGALRCGVVWCGVALHWAAWHGVLLCVAVHGWFGCALVCKRGGGVQDDLRKRLVGGGADRVFIYHSVGATLSLASGNATNR